MDRWISTDPEGDSRVPGAEGGGVGGHPPEGAVGGGVAVGRGVARHSEIWDYFLVTVHNGRSFILILQ